MQNIINFDNYEKFRITSKFEMLKYLKQVQEEHVSLSLVFIKNDLNIYETKTMIFISTQDEIEAEILSVDLKRIEKQYGIKELLIQARFELDGVQYLVEFNDVSLKSVENNKFSSILLNNIKNFIRIQRREYFRVSVPKDEELYLSFKLFNKENKRNVFYNKIKIIDLSMGGLSLYFEYPKTEDINMLLNVGDILENVTLELPQITSFLQNEYTLNLEVRNIKNKKSTKMDMNAYSIGLKFVKLNGAFDRHLMILSNNYARKKHLHNYKDK